ncbi:endonuclease V [Hordeum vulgare]|nr:endonuclease V [Hordeum vulgare]
MRVSPGLSSFAADTARMAESLRPLMEFAKEKVGGEGAAAATEVRLMATVGLRLLEESVRGAILVSCRNALRASGFRFEDSWAKVIPGWHSSWSRTKWKSAAKHNLHSADGQAQIDGDQEAIIQDRTESDDGGSAESTGKVDPQTSAWTKRVGNQTPDRATCPERVGALEQTIRGYADKLGDHVVERAIGLTFDSLCEAYDFYNLDPWEHGFDIRTQDVLKGRLVLEDDFEWSLPSVSPSSDQSGARGKLKYIGGVDISFLKEDPSTACAAAVVLDADTLGIVHEEFDVVRMQVPYIAGFLAFREAPILLGLLEKIKINAHHFYPQLVMVDGNGLLHPRAGFGLACHLGVLADLPTIGVGKNLHHVDGLNQSEVRKQLEAKGNCNEECISLTGQSGTTWGAAMCSCSGSSRPIYISVGHRISLDSAIGIVKYCSRYRIPEPTRQADIRSKVFLQKHQRLQQ